MTAVAVDARRRAAHYIDEPAAHLATAARGHRRRDHARRGPPGRSPYIAATAARRCSRRRGELLHLGEADRRRHVGEPIVEAEPVVVEPAHVDGAALVALGAQARRRVAASVADDHAPLPRGHLLVGVEGEDREKLPRVPTRSGPPSFDRAERLGRSPRGPRGRACAASASSSGHRRRASRRCRIGNRPRGTLPGDRGRRRRRDRRSSVTGIDVDEDRLRPLVEERSWPRRRR